MSNYIAKHLLNKLLIFLLELYKLYCITTSIYIKNNMLFLFMQENEGYPAIIQKNE